MRKFLCALAVVVAFGISAGAIPQESVRAELIRKQKESGLTLATFYRSVETISFADRSSSTAKDLLPPGAMEGALSRDGSEIAVSFWQPRIGSSLRIIRFDGTDVSQYSNIASHGYCWSYDRSELAMSEQNRNRGATAPNDSVAILKLATKESEVVDVRASVTSQCFAPNSKKIVYEADRSVRVFDRERKQWQVLAKGEDATWSPDGKWIAFRDDDTFYAISPSGESRRELFVAKGALSGLWWSPDSRIVAYVSRNRPLEPPLVAVDVGWVRLRVRRLDDGSEDWVEQLSDAYVPSYQWVELSEHSGQALP
jgi:WD40 repeat protein